MKYDTIIHLKDVVIRFTGEPQNEITTTVGVGNPNPELWDTDMSAIIFHCFDDDEDYRSLFSDRKDPSDEEFEIVEELSTRRLDADDYIKWFKSIKPLDDRKTVWLLYIDHEEGIRKSLHSSKRGAEMALKEFILEAGAKSEKDYFYNTNPADWFVIEELEIN